MDDRGTWVTADASEGSAYTYRLKEIDGEWRITNPQSGILLNTDSFSRIYDPYALYYLDATQEILTPDPVYLPIAPNAATSLVNDLLLGPSESLRGVASSVAPAGTTVDSVVTISSTGRAEVPLTDGVLALSPDDRQLFAAQLTWTLRQIPAIREIRVTVDGSPFEVEGAADNVFGVEDFSGLDPAGLSGDRRLYALARQALVAVDPAETTVITGPVADVRGTSVAVDPFGDLAALVDKGSIVVAGMGSGSEVAPRPWIDDATRLLKPSWDQHGVLWAVDVQSGTRGAPSARLLAATPDGGAVEVDAPGLTGADVRAFAVSRDGVRAAAIVQQDGVSKLTISVIDRDPQDPSIVSLGPAQTVMPAQLSLPSMSALAWRSPTMIVVLGRERGDDVQPFEIEIDGSQITPTGVLQPVIPQSLAAGPSLDAPIVIGDESGQIFVLTPERWAQFGDGTTPLRAPTYPG